MMRSEIKDRLLPLADTAYRDFHLRLVPELTAESMLGVRMPDLRKLGRLLVAEGYADAVLHDDTPDTYHEETMLRGIVLGAAKLTLPARLVQMGAFVPRISNWSLCDSFVSSLRFRADELCAVRSFLTPYLESGEEFPARFGCVMLLRFFVREDCLADTLNCLTAVPAASYNARMGAAWALAECLVRYPEPTLRHLETCTLDRWTRRKTLQKALESKRLPENLRPVLQRLRKT